MICILKKKKKKKKKGDGEFFEISLGGTRRNIIVNI
jgi:hypothetical protein